MIGNKWHNNPGVAEAAGGVGGLIQYINGGPFSSVNHPPSSITVKRDIYANNGAAQAGAGILVGAAAITNVDELGFRQQAHGLIVRARPNCRVFPRVERSVDRPDH